MIGYSWSKSLHSRKPCNENSPCPIVNPKLYASLGSIFASSVSPNVTYAARRVAILAKRGRASKSNFERLLTQPPCPEPAEIDPFFWESSLLFQDDTEAEVVDNAFSCQKLYIDGRDKNKAMEMRRAKRKMHKWSLAKNFPLEDRLAEVVALGKSRDRVRDRIAELMEEEERVRRLDREQREALDLKVNGMFWYYLMMGILTFDLNSYLFVG